MGNQEAAHGKRRAWSGRELCGRVAALLVASV